MRPLLLMTNNVRTDDAVFQLHNKKSKISASSIGSPTLTNRLIQNTPMSKFGVWVDHLIQTPEITKKTITAVTPLNKTPNAL